MLGDLIRSYMYGKHFAAAHRYLFGRVRHVIPTYALSSDDEKCGPNTRLLDLVQNSISRARSIDLSWLEARYAEPLAGHINNWPGNHYRFLAALTEVLAPEHIIEVGTYAGAATLTFKNSLPSNGRVTSYDVIPWRHIPNQGICEEDIDKNLVLKTCDLTRREVQVAETDNICDAELIFIDASHDGLTEHRLLDFIESIPFRQPPVVVLDDIHMPALLPIWREIHRPKIDATSFAHWSGTGIVDWVAEATTK